MDPRPSPAPDPIAALVEATAVTAPHHTQPYEHLYALRQTIAAYDALTADLRDNVLHVAHIGGGRVERVTCSPRADDGGRLWFWASDRTPLGEPGLLTDAALAIARRLR